MIDGLTNFDEIENYMSLFLENRYQEIKAELSLLSKEKSILGINKGEISEKKKKLYKEMSQIFNIYITYDTMLRKVTTFERRQVARLFTTYYSALYNKSFTTIKVNDNLVIASQSDLGDSAILEEISIKELLETSQDACIVLSHPFYTLLDGTHLSSDFAPFTEIMPVIKYLVNLHITNQEMNDRQRISTALESAIADLKDQKKLEKSQN